MAILLIDYQMGNLRSVAKALERVGAQVTVADAPPAGNPVPEAIVLPGVGHFGAAMHNLNQSGWTDYLKRALADKVPYLGLCLGLQLLYEASEEAPGVAGLGVLPGTVTKFPDFRSQGLKLPVPHMGWNQVAVTDGIPLWRGIRDQAYFYFVHSYYAPLGPATIGACTYGLDFSAGIQQDTITALQFHPEKSQGAGLQVLKNFINSTGVRV